MAARKKMDTKVTNETPRAQRTFVPFVQALCASCLPLNCFVIPAKAGSLLYQGHDNLPAMRSESLVLFY
jgi:hypothetical protein